MHRPFRERARAHHARHRHLWDLSAAAIGVAFFVFGFIVGEETDLYLITTLVVTTLFLLEFSVLLWCSESRRLHLRGHWFDVVICLPFLPVLRGLRALGQFPRLVQALGHVLHITRHGTRGALMLRSTTRLRDSSPEAPPHRFSAPVAVVGEAEPVEGGP